MRTGTRVSIRYKDTELVGDITSDGQKPELLILHGAGKSNRNRYDELRSLLAEKGVSTLAFDFIGHGETGGNIEQSSLRDRTEQAQAVITGLGLENFSILGSSMSGYTAIKLTELFPVKTLILYVPAVYSIKAYDLNFNSDFSGKIREADSWMNTDAWDILKKFTGRLLIVYAGRDEVIPPEVVENIFSNAQSARKKELQKFPGSEHRINYYLQQHPSEMAKAAEKIVEFIL